MHLEGGGWYLDLPNDIMSKKEAIVFKKRIQKIEAQQSANLHVTHILINRTIVFF
jgi:hypothetical protein